MGKAVGITDIRTAQGKGNPVTGATPVVLGHVGTKDKPGGIRIAHIGTNGTGRLLFHLVFHIYQIVGIRHAGCVSLHHAEVTQPLQSLAGQIDQGGIGWRLFKLAQFTAQHFVVGFRITAEIDATNIHLATRLHIKGHINRVVFVIGVVLTAIDLGKGVTLVTKATLEQIIGVGHQLLAEYLPFLHHQQGFKLLFGYHQITGQADLVDRVLLTFRHVHGNEHATTVRGNRHLGGFDGKVDVATVQIVGAQTLQITAQFLPGILVIALDKGPEPGGIQLKILEQFFIVEQIITDDIDIANARRLAFIDLDFQGYPVTRQRHGLGLDICAIAALADVLALQLTGNGLQGGPLKHLAFGQAGFGQPLAQVFLVDGLVAGQFNTGNAGALGHHHDQIIAITAQLHVLEVSSGKQALYRVHDLITAYGVTSLNGQLRIHSFHRQALQAFHSDIVHFERQ